MDIKVQIKQTIFMSTILLMSCSFVFADEDRHVTVDREVGGMEQGIRIGSPGSAPTSAHTTISSSQGTKKAGADSAQSVTIQENHGVIYTNPAQANDTAGSTSNGSETSTGGSQQTQPGETQPVETPTGGSTESPTAPVSNPIDSVTETPVTNEPSVESGGSDAVTAPAGGSNNPIVDADVNVNPDSGTVEAGATVDTTGELEERQILDADLAAEGLTSIEGDVTSATDLTGSEVVESADLTTSGQTGQTSGSTATQESSSPSGNPIVSADANVNPESGAVEGGATVDTSGELEEKQILDADVATGETTATPEVGSATDITQSDVVESADITTEPIKTVTPIPSDLTAEVDSTGATAGSEADVGIEADLSGLSEGEDVTCDPADGLLASSACADLKF